MATPLDAQVTFLKETTYGTPVTPTRALEVLPDSSHKFDRMTMHGEGMRVGYRYPRIGRRVAGVGKGDFTVKYELTSKGLGALFELVAGTAEHTLVAGSTFQQRFRPLITTPFFPSSTWQYGIPLLDASGTVHAFTYAGCVAKSFQIEAPANGIPTVAVDFWASSLATATALATWTPPTTPTLYSDGSANAGTTLGGTLTMPTTTVLATGGTVASNIRSWTFSVDLGVNERPRKGGWQQPTMGKPSATLEIVQDYDAATLRDLFLSQASTSFSGWFTGANLSTGTERFELDIPTIAIDDDAFGQISNGEGSVPTIKFAVEDNGTDPAWAITTRTADTVL